MKKEEEMIFSWIKFGRAIKKFWYIWIILLVISTVVVGTLFIKEKKTYNNNINKNNIEQTEENASEIKEVVQPYGNYYFVEHAYVDFDWNDNLSEQEHKDMMEAYSNMIKYKAFRDSLNMKSRASGYSSILVTDIYSCTVESSSQIDFCLYGQTTLARMDGILDLIVETFIEQVNLVNSDICITRINKSEIFFATSNGSSLSDSTRPAAEWLILQNAKVQKESTSKTTDVNNTVEEIKKPSIVDKKNLLIIAIFICVGIIFTFIVSIRDDTIVSIAEVEYCGLECLGIVEKNSKVESIIEKIKLGMKKRGYDRVDFISSVLISEQKENLRKYFDDNQLSLINMEDVDIFTKVEKEDQVIIIINKAKTSQKQLKKCIHDMKLIGASFWGFVWIE